MAVESLKRSRKPKRPSSNSSSSSPPMASSSPTRPNLGRRRVSLPSVLVALSVLLLLYVTSKKMSITSLQSLPSPTPQLYTFDIVNEFPHDPDAFTQGLLYGGNETLFESTGLYWRSSVRQVLLQTGKVLVHYQLDGSYFGEGLTLLGERLFQVTWLKNIGFTYDRYNFSKREMFTHQMQDGWGLATDGNVIFGSDGSSTLYQLDPVTWKVIKKVTVRHGDRDISFVNELEYVNDEVWANIWQTDCVARISHHDGKVLGWILLHELRESLLKDGHTGIDVLNGIAWDEEQNRLFVTGKLWPKLYEIKLRPIAPVSNQKLEALCPIVA